MNSWRFLFKNLGNSRQISAQQLRTVFVFLILYLIMVLPVSSTNEAKSFLLPPLLMIQGICLVTVLMQVDPIFRTDVHDGFLETWLANHGLSVRYYLGRHLLIFFEIIVPAVTLATLLAPSLTWPNHFLFLCLNLVIAILTSLWSSSIALLLTRNHDIGQSLVGMVLVPLFLIPQLLIGETILQEMITSAIALSHLWLYGGVSLLSMAINLALAPIIIRLSIDC